MNNEKKFKYAYEISLHDDTTPSKILRLVGKNKRVLELGCGPGHMSKVMKEQLACHVTGIEVDKEAAKEAQKYCDLVKACDLDQEDLAQLFASERFDVILMADVLEHLKQPQRILQQSTKLLTPKGYIVISIPNVAHQGIIASLMAAQFPYSELGLLDKTHLRFFTGPSFRDLLSRCDLCIEKWLTHEVPVEFTEFSQFFECLPEAIREFLDRCPDSKVYQFIIRAIPSSHNNFCEEGDLNLSSKLNESLESCLKERNEWFKEHYLFMHKDDLLETNKDDKHGFINKILAITKRFLSHT